VIQYNNMSSQKIKKIKKWCQICDTAILSGNVCPVCKTDNDKFNERNNKKKKNNFNRKPLRD